MSIQLDRRKQEKYYVDKCNLHRADDDSIIKLINTGKEDKSHIYLNIISAGNKLNSTEYEILKYIFDKDIVCSINNVIKDCMNITDKSHTTIYRAIGRLQSLKLIVFSNKEIKLNPAINVNRELLNNSKFIILEINPDSTDNKITL